MKALPNDSNVLFTFNDCCSQIQSMKKSYMVVLLGTVVGTSILHLEHGRKS